MTPATRRDDYSVLPQLSPRSAQERSAPLRAVIPMALAGLRLDQALARLFPDYSRSRLQQWIRDGQVQVNGTHARPRAKVWGGEEIEVSAKFEPGAGVDRPQQLPLTVVFEDDAILVVDKPAGLVVHPGHGNREGTLLNALLHHAPALAALPRAGIVHRLDKHTSGLIVVAKTLTAQTSLVRQLQARSVGRDYLAVVLGVPARAGEIDAPIGRHPTLRTRMAVVANGKAAVTRYRVVRAGAGWSLLECSLQTGRTHQIRVHLAAVGHPLIGDPVYLRRNSARALPGPAREFPRQALHAARLTLLHPFSAERLQWQTEPPPDLSALLACLERDAPAS